MIAEEARNFLKIGNALCGRSKKLLKTWLYLSEPKQRAPLLVDVPSWEAEANYNPTLNDYGISYWLEK
jgi:hypothetical protein